MKTIYLTRHGESEGQLNKIVGGNSSITGKGKKYSNKLREYLDDKNVNIIMCSQLKRAVETAEIVNLENKYLISEVSNLNEIDGGIFEGWTTEKVKEKHPKIYEHRNKNKFLYSYPMGESYQDLEKRINPILKEIDNTSENLVIIAHQAVCRIIFCHLMKKDVEDCTNIDINSHYVYRFTCNNDNMYNMENISFV